jgi:acrylyl-CoA reductase (NADPH)
MTHAYCNTYYTLVIYKADQALKAGCGFFISSIFPLIINGITLLGVDSMNGPVDMRMKVWNKVASDWKLDRLEKITTKLPSLEALEERIGLTLEGKSRGRAIVKVSG